MKRMKWKDLTKIMITGSRRFAEPDLATMFIDKYIRRNFESKDDVVIFSGDAIGIDDAFYLYCKRAGIKHLVFNARWAELAPPAGKNPAGVIRNQHMVDMAHECYAFWDGQSPGTRDSFRRAKKKGIPTRIFSVDGLRKELNIPPPVKLYVPSGSKLPRKMRANLTELVKDADIKGLMREGRKKKKKKKKVKPLEQIRMRLEELGKK